MNSNLLTILLILLSFSNPWTAQAQSSYFQPTVLDCIAMNKVVPVGTTTPCRYSSKASAPWDVGIYQGLTGLSNAKIIELTDKDFFTKQEVVVVPVDNP